MNIKFLMDSKGNLYTTAFMIGEKLRKSGIPFNQDDNGSYHYGSCLNHRLANGLKKSYRAGGNVDYTLDDFPKLPDVEANREVIAYLISQNMCNDSSVALTKSGGTLRAVDLYTLRVFKQLLDSYHIGLTETDNIEVVGKVNNFTLTLIHSERDEVTSDTEQFLQNYFKLIKE